MRSDGLCMGCYDAGMALDLGITYGGYISKFGHNYRRGERESKRLMVCAFCGGPLTGRRHGAKYCSDACRSRAVYFRAHLNDPQIQHRNCRGCRSYVPGSKRCANKDSPYFGTDRNKACGLYERFGGDNG